MLKRSIIGILVGVFWFWRGVDLLYERTCAGCGDRSTDAV